MRTTLAIARKEIVSYLTTPWAWVVFTAMALISAFFFLVFIYDFQDAHTQVRAARQGWSEFPEEFQIFRNLTEGVVVRLWGALMVLTLFVAPFLSMRLFAEEKQNKTFELLMTAPIRPIEIVLGKYLGAVVVVVLTLGVTIVYPVILSFFGQSQSGDAVEWRVVFLGYGGLLLWGATNMAIGMFISSLTQSQLVAAIVSFGIALAWMLVQQAAPQAGEPLRSFLKYLAFEAQLSNLIKGVLDLKPLVFFGSVIALFVMLTHRSIEAQRWT